MSDAKDKTIALNVRLKPVDHSNLPHQTNYSNVGVAKGLPIWILVSSSRPCWVRSLERRRTVKPHRRRSMASSSPAWRWASMCWRDCISRFSKC